MSEHLQKLNENQSLEEMMFGMTQFTQAIQNEIAIALVMSPQIRAKIEKTINKPDHEIVDTLNKSVRDFIVSMAIAESYGVNIMMNVIATHSSITGNPALAESIITIGEKIQQINNLTDE